MVKPLFAGIALAGAVVASFTPAATTSAVAQQLRSDPIVEPSPCGWPPPTPSPIYVLGFPKNHATDVSPANVTVIISASGPDHVVTLTSFRGAQAALRQDATVPEWFKRLPGMYGDLESYTFAGLHPGTLYVVSVQDSHWIPDAPCVAPEVSALGSFTTSGSP